MWKNRPGYKVHFGNIKSFTSIVICSHIQSFVYSKQVPVGATWRNLVLEMITHHTPHTCCWRDSLLTPRHKTGKSALCSAQEGRNTFLLGGLNSWPIKLKSQWIKSSHFSLTRGKTTLRCSDLLIFLDDYIKKLRYYWYSAVNSWIVDLVFIFPCLAHPFSFVLATQDA